MGPQHVGEAGQAMQPSPAPGPGRSNVVILTGGLTGSSALAGRLTAAGYRSGEDTFKKSDYNTYENSDLIRLNRQLMKRVEVGEEYTATFQPEAELVRIGRFPGTDLTLEHLASTYSGPLRRRPKAWRDGVEAGLIFLKNYRERIG